MIAFGGLTQTGAPGRAAGDRPRAMIATAHFLRFIHYGAPHVGPVAQWSEPAAHNGLVAGSSPARPTKFFQGFRDFRPPAESNPHRFPHRYPFLPIARAASS